MLRAEDNESMFLSLGSSLQALNERVTGLKNCQTVRKLRKTKVFIQTQPLISMFLAIFIVPAFLPFLVFAAFVSSSFLFVAVSAIAVFGGTFAVAFASFLVVMFPILMFGAAVAISIYFSYLFTVSTLRMIKQFRDMILSFPSKILPEFIRFGNLKMDSQHFVRRELEERIQRGNSNEYERHQEWEYYIYQTEGRVIRLQSA